MPWNSYEEKMERVERRWVKGVFKLPWEHTWKWNPINHASPCENAASATVNSQIARIGDLLGDCGGRTKGPWAKSVGFPFKKKGRHFRWDWDTLTGRRVQATAMGSLCNKRVVQRQEDEEAVVYRTEMLGFKVSDAKLLLRMTRATVVMRVNCRRGRELEFIVNEAWD